jgi:cation diffusion facilitator CzcD-associated flavoprotein CzcO
MEDGLVNIATAPTDTDAGAEAQAAGHFDVLIVGAGISGIDAAYHLQQECPQKSFVLLETQESFGGTWSTHKYPGIRSDSDLFTFGYKWKPWMSAPIATAQEILTYLDETLDEQDIRRHIRYQHQVISASWSSEEEQWTITAQRLNGAEPVRFTANFLWMCQGYYRHQQGYTPEWPGMEDYRGEVVHPQTWPEDLEYKGKHVLVIGSGATAATLVPAMAEDCAHITMLQRSPTYFAPAPNRNDVADMLRELDVPDEWTHEIVRRKILQDQQEITRRSFEEPEVLKEELIGAAREYLGENFDIATHFTPNYRPWRQRLAFIPDGDLFQGIAAGKASVVTDQIERFTQKGVLLKSGKELEADIIVTATGFNLCVLGDIAFSVDDKPVDFADTVTYRGMMFSGVPNMAWVFGYFRASWTLRADLIAEFLCRLFNHMKEIDADVVTPTLRAEDDGMQRLPWIDPENFNPGYLTRSIHLMPAQGDREPWIFTQDYYKERDEFPAADLEDGSLAYRGASSASDSGAAT